MATNGVCLEYMDLFRFVFKKKNKHLLHHNFYITQTVWLWVVDVFLTLFLSRNRKASTMSQPGVVLVLAPAYAQLAG